MLADVPQVRRRAIADVRGLPLLLPIVALVLGKGAPGVARLPRLGLNHVDEAALLAWRTEPQREAEDLCLRLGDERLVAQVDEVRHADLGVRAVLDAP